MKLTKSVIDAFKYSGPDPRRDARWDDEISGFGVRVYPSGKKSFIISYRIGRTKHQMTLGDFGILTLSQARNMAKQELAKVTMGVDPLARRNRGVISHNMKAFCDLYISRYAKTHKKTWKEDQRKINKFIIPKWGNHAIKSIARTDVAAFHANMGKETPYEANRLLRLLSKMFTLAIEWGLLDETDQNPAKSIRLFKEQKRDRWLKPDELPRLAEALQLEQNEVARNAIWLYLFTGARKSELLQAKWDNIDWDRNELKIPDTKAGRVHYIPLSAPAQQLLKRINPTADNPHIFPGHIRGKHLVNISKPWNRLRIKADIKDVRLHDLRRTVGSWLAQSGNSLHLIGKILNHSSQSTTAIYARFAQDQGRQALEEYGEKLVASSNIKESNRSKGDFNDESV